jgi:hypothetical protein
MNNQIAIIDFKNQDSGLKIIFPEADYFILEEEFDRSIINNKYNIKPIVHNKDVNVFEFINDEKYDYLFIIGGLYGSLETYNKKNNMLFNKKYKEQLRQTIEFINKNNFKKICFFDNYDYDYDPNIIFEEEFKKKYVIFFKRYYNKEKIYNENVFPFPYIIFGYQCNIEMITDLYYKNIEKNNEKINRIFFSGSPLIHIDDTYGVIRERQTILNKISNIIPLQMPGYLYHDDYMNEMIISKYSLDLLGVGDPNIRTFEILSSGSLRLGEKSNLKWTFEEEFCEETIFEDENDLLTKLLKLENYPELYKKCINKQNEIVEKYMNSNILKEYIFEKINK